MVRRITLKDLAEDIGLSQQAVSLALRGARGVGETTRRKVRARAAELGYEPDPALRALADYRTRGRPIATRWNQVALLHNWTTEGGLVENPFYAGWFRELKTAARERGMAIEVIWLGSDGQRGPAVFRSLRNRGISGIFLAPPAMRAEPNAIHVPGGDFQAVTFGPEHLYPDLHTVQFDFYGNLRLAWRMLWERGRRRIGLVESRDHGWRTGHVRRAAFHVEQFLTGGPAKTCQPLELTGSKRAQRAQYRDWLREGRYDAVISGDPWVTKPNPARRHAPEVALLNAQGAGGQGIDLNLPQMARTAVELLILEMQQSLAREKSLPFRVHIPGRWVEAAERPC